MRKLKKEENKTIAVELLKRSISYKEFAEKIGMSYPSLLRRMSGNVEWQISEMKKVSQVLGETLDYLFENNMNVQ